MVQSQDTSVDKNFRLFSEIAVFVLILLHPILFIAQRYIDTGQLSPESYIGYTGEERVWLIGIAIIALIAFLAYDVLRKFQERLKQRNLWRYVSLSQAIAIILIFIHALGIGSYMSSPWFEFWWLSTNIILLPCLLFHLMNDFKVKI